MGILLLFLLSSYVLCVSRFCSRIKEARQRESVKSFVGRQRKLPTQASKQRNEVSQDSNRYYWDKVTLVTYLENNQARS